jgi:hypothetical protein
MQSQNEKVYQNFHITKYFYECLSKGVLVPKAKILSEQNFEIDF